MTLPDVCFDGLVNKLDLQIGGRVVWTPEVEQLGRAAANWMLRGLPGGAAYGQQRCGKSKAIRYLERAFPEFLGTSIPIFSWAVGETRAALSEVLLLRGFLNDCGHALTSSRDKTALTQRLVNHIAQKCDEQKTRRLLIFVDEAQNIHLANFGVLIEIYNRLEVLNYKPFILLVGQPELGFLPSTILEESKLHIYGRFFKRTIQYQGIQVKDFKKILESFDEECIQADGGTLPPLSIDFFPDRYREGWRLTNLSRPLEDALGQLLDKEKVQKSFRIPMQDLVSAIRGLVAALCTDNALFEKNLAHEAADAFKEAGLAETLLAYARQQRS